jgi:hypothetical protein
MSKTLTTRQFATIKRVAQNVNPLVIKKGKIIDKITKLEEEFKALCEEIEGHEMGIKSITGGYTSENLVIKKVEDTGKTDKDGNPVKVTKYEPNPDKVYYNEELNVYNIIEPMDISDIQDVNFEPEAIEEETILG